ncbi:MAG: hypothetical protein EOP34_02780 [Rickettsiales bacterium]|nr:MAG: hypothetical protein EOP34_02780 [Rickettsiales bacterium]
MVNKIMRNFFSINPLANNVDGKKSKLLQRRYRRLSLNKILVSKSEIKHSNDKVFITLYVFNKKKASIMRKIHEFYEKIRLKTFSPAKPKQSFIKLIIAKNNIRRKKVRNIKKIMAKLLRSNVLFKIRYPKKYTRLTSFRFKPAQVLSKSKSVKIYTPLAQDSMLKYDSTYSSFVSKLYALNQKQKSSIKSGNQKKIEYYKTLCGLTKNSIYKSFLETFAGTNTNSIEEASVIQKNLTSALSLNANNALKQDLHSNTLEVKKNLMA